MADPVSGTRHFVARLPGRWELTTVPGERSTEIDLDALLEAAALAPPAPLRSGEIETALVVHPVAEEDLLDPVWLLVGELCEEGLLVEDASGGQVVLDEVDLRLVDLLDHTFAAGELADVAGTDRADAMARLARLAATGKAHRTPVAPPAPVEEPEPEPPSAPGPEIVSPVTPSTLARVRHRARRAVLDRVPHSVRMRARAYVDGVPLSSMAPADPVTVPDEELGPIDEVEPEAELVEAESPDEPEVVVDPIDPVVPDGPSGRVPVYAVWHPHAGPLLALGMLTATARELDGGRLAEHFEIRRPETAASFLADVARRSGPAVMLCSDYVWSLEANLEAAQQARALNPELIVIHGGPSSPKYEGDAERFLDDHGDVAHVVTRGEGERTICEVLDTLRSSLPGLDPEALAKVDGITFRDPRSGEVVRTPDRERIATLDDLPSPYLLGEFDHIDAEAWNTCLAIETNRGCPYGCTFCDWGSSTLSRIRKFDHERVKAELRWAAERGVGVVNIADANFGIMSRDVETAREAADLKRRTGAPKILVFYPAKNTTKHLIRILDTVAEAGIGIMASISLQSHDPGTLEAIDRSNISTDNYVALAADHRRRGHALQGELLVGLPGQTYDSYRSDLQFMLDHEIQARSWPVQVLPNAPMNDPDYRTRWAIETDEHHLVQATSTFTRADRDRMLRLRKVDIISERFGIYRHLMRWLQWDHGITATDFMNHLIDVTATTPHRLPHTTWLLDYFDLHPTAPVGWRSLYDEIRQLLHDDLDITPSTALDTVLALQHFLMPTPGRAFPATITLAHDYLAYYRNATHTLYTTGHATTPDQPLHHHPPTTFTITADPLDVCRNGIIFGQHGDGGVMQGDFAIGANAANELASPLLRVLPHVAAEGIPAVIPDGLEPDDEPIAGDGVPVRMLSRPGV
jgi:hypothetical protein